MGGLIFTEERRVEIEEKAKEINVFSERYQLIHATYAIEKMFKEELKKYYDGEFAKLRKQLFEAESKEQQDQIFRQVEELKNESNKKVRIIIDYIPQIENDSARVTTTKNNTIMISLPKSMENVRMDDGKIDFDLLKYLRKIMGHEIGHVVLHSKVLHIDGKNENKLSEEEADFFSEQLLDMRKTYTRELANGL